jgi:hypothetical protein
MCIVHMYIQQNEYITTIVQMYRYYIAHSTYTVYLEIHSFCPIVRIGTSQPLSRKRVCPPPGTKSGDTLSCGWRCGGGPNKDDWRKSLALCLLYSVLFTIYSWDIEDFEVLKKKLKKLWMHNLYKTHPPPPPNFLPAWSNSQLCCRQCIHDIIWLIGQDIP